MEKQTFQGYNCDLAQLQKSAGTYFAGKCYRITNFFKEKLYITQAYKSQMVSKAVICQIQGVPENFDIVIGLSTKITTVNALPQLERIPFDTKVLLGEPFLERSFLKYISTQAELKRNTFGLAHYRSPTPLTPAAPVWKEREIVREIEVVYCRHCSAKNNARQTNCSNCNAPLH